MKAESQIEITPTSVVLNGKAIAVEATGEKMLVELYRRFVGDYPKFFKMDTLSRLGFIAAELLLKHSGASEHSDKICQPSAVILANRSASIKNDRDYLATISEGNYYPSPSLFVYTLPNIVTGEIAIRHHIQGETAFYILEKPEDLEPIIKSQMTNDQSPILYGWCECSEPNSFYAKMQLIIWNN
ncbi:MAG: hypothetical protein IJQ20_09290 [Paludibacteraceae bacterium]|nr:hypothetical protein [Paludibacteraceae bacterium]